MTDEQRSFIDRNLREGAEAIDVMEAVETTFGLSSKDAEAAVGKVAADPMRPCPRPCGECSALHHFSDPMRYDEGNYVCKHCDATVPMCSLCGEAAWPPPQFQDTSGDVVCSGCAAGPDSDPAVEPVGGGS